METLLGIDCGLTMTKAVVFSLDGRVLGLARKRVPQSIPKSRHVERDLKQLWQATAAAIAESLMLSGQPGDRVRAIAATAHGDGLFLLDRERQPLGPGILSLDSRANDILSEWADGDVLDKALATTGQQPHLSAPSTLLAWIRRHEPESYSRIAHVIGCKDWLTYCLTGNVVTDRTEASTSFTDVNTQVYSPAALELFGLEEIEAALPGMLHSAAVAGEVTAEASRLTGLREGTPVAAGLHDVTASGLGIGGQRPGIIDVVAGTYSINQTVSMTPKTDARWFCRNGIEPGHWNNMSISPASTANYDWFVDTLCERDLAEHGSAVHDHLGREIDQALRRPLTLFFHPYLYGSPYGELSSGGFTGLHGWHQRGDLLRAVLEGIAFNHRFHIDALRDGFEAESVRLTGGVSRSERFVRLFANAIGMPVTVTETDEAAAWGAALCAATAAGCITSVADDPRDLHLIERIQAPDPDRAAAYDKRHALYLRIAESQRHMWADIDALAHEAPVD